MRIHGTKNAAGPVLTVPVVRSPSRAGFGRWHLYYLLVASFLITILLSLAFNELIRRTYAESIETNARWGRRLADYSDLGRLASAVNAPGNDLFDSQDVETESGRMRLALERFTEQLAVLRDDMRGDAVEAEAARLLEDFDAIGACMAEMTEEAELIFSHFSQGEVELAARRMANMDRKYGEVNLALARLRQDVSTVQRDHFAQQQATADGLAKLQYLLAASVLVALSAASIYGHRMARRAELFEAEHEARARAEAEVRAREEFLSIAAHELNTPLTSVRGFTQFLEKQMDRAAQADPAELRHIVDGLDQASERLARLVERLLDVTRLERGTLRLERQETDLVDVVHQTVEAARRMTDRHRLMVRAPGRAMAPVDPLRMEQVLTNLLDNAIKYSPEGGEIEVEVAGDGPEAVQLAIRDHGLGVQPEQRPHIFDRFFRAHKTHYGGMGLGLYISRQIVEQHGGDLVAEFPDDGGTRMVVRLPAELPAGIAEEAEVAR